MSDTEIITGVTGDVGVSVSVSIAKYRGVSIRRTFEDVSNQNRYFTNDAQTDGYYTDDAISNKYYSNDP